MYVAFGNMSGTDCLAGHVNTELVLASTRKLPVVQAYDSSAMSSDLYFQMRKLRKSKARM